MDDNNNKNNDNDNNNKTKKKKKDKKNGDRTPTTTAVDNLPLTKTFDILVGLFANPVSNNAFTSQSPELSPVNILPVLFPPFAAGANPITNNLALGSPKVGTGFAQ